MRVLVCGCGRIGSPMLTWIAHQNMSRDDVEVAGVDVDPNVLGELRPRFRETNWDEYHNALVREDRVPYIYSYKELYYVQDVIIVTCGTPIDRNQNPDTTQVFAAIDSLVHAGAVSDDTLIIMRSTLFPGCTKLLRKRLNDNFNLNPEIVMAPERIAEGYTFAEIDQIPQIIGADTNSGMKRAAEFFSNVFGSKSLAYIFPDEGGTTGAELAKLFCNTYRYVNFALANEFALICDENEVDYRVVRSACNTNYWRSDISGAALNLGGPCLGKDAKTLAAYTKNAKITEAAYDVAEKTAMYFVNKHKEKIKNGKVGVLGLAFKRNSDNPMNSLSFKVLKHLEILGADIVVHDPYITHTYSKPLEEVIKSDVIFVMTEHDCFQTIEFEKHQTIIRL